MTTSYRDTIRSARKVTLAPSPGAVKKLEASTKLYMGGAEPDLREAEDLTEIRIGVQQ